ncbi:uncharacterized protein LOC134246534 [Saccostrea cucullata]|uniref:uncharacterized protein LOC134246534 n=1 Tax=Saccostrea cuccullata TaxID=36930 RepID=UPI002ED6781F
MNSLVSYFLLVGLLRNLVSPLRCYECDLIGNKSANSCFDPLDTDHDDVRITECKNSLYSCIKAKTIFKDGDVFYQRKCQKVKIKNSCKLLHINETKYLLTVELCSCQHDLCNAGDKRPALAHELSLSIFAFWIILKTK